MKKRWSLLNIVIVIIALVTGVLADKLITNWPILQLKYEVDVINAITSFFSLIVTLLAAYWVANFLERQKEANRVEKDLFIKRIEDVYVLIELLSQKISTQEIDYIEASASLKRINIQFRSIFSCIANTELNPDLNYKGETENTLSTLKDLLTNTPVIAEADMDSIPLTIRDGVIHITNERKLQIDSTFDTLKINIFNLELMINKA